MNGLQTGIFFSFFFPSFQDFLIIWFVFLFGCRIIYASFRTFLGLWCKMTVRILHTVRATQLLPDWGFYFDIFFLFLLLSSCRWKGRARGIHYLTFYISRYKKYSI